MLEHLFPKEKSALDKIHDNLRLMAFLPKITEREYLRVCELLIEKIGINIYKQRDYPLESKMTYMFIEKPKRTYHIFEYHSFFYIVATTLDYESFYSLEYIKNEFDDKLDGYFIDEHIEYNTLSSQYDYRVREGNIIWKLNNIING